jgi:hypothetical protein
MFHPEKKKIIIDKNVTTKQNRRSRGGRKFLTLGRNI